VTNPPANCRTPSQESIWLASFLIRASEALAVFNKPWKKYAKQWAPLPLMIAWVNQHPEKVTLRQSKQWIEDALRTLSQ
jgi:hypothetical protein